MTPEKIAEIRQNATLSHIQKLWMDSVQLGANSTADAAAALAELAEAKARIAELEAEKTLPPTP